MTFHNPIHEGTAFETKAEGDLPNADTTDVGAVVAAALESIRTGVAARLDALETKSADTATTARITALEQRLSRPNIITTPAEAPEAIETKAFTEFLRTGEKHLDPENRKMLRSSVNTAGGFLVTPAFETEFVRDLTLASPIRAIADVRATGVAQVFVPIRTGITNARWQGEAVATVGSEPSFAQTQVNIKTLATHVDLSNQLADDTFANIDQEVRLALAEDFAAKESLAFLFGDGNLEPVGLMTDTTVPVILNGHATALSADQLISTIYALPAPYRARGTWLMSSLTLAVVRKIKDSAGNYIWQPGLQAGTPETLLGRPVAVSEDMAAVGAGAFPIVFGDFKSAFRIYDRADMDVRVNPFLLMTEGQTRYHGTRRVGSVVVQPKALLKFKMATA